MDGLRNTPLEAWDDDMWKLFEKEVNDHMEMYKDDDAHIKKIKAKRELMEYFSECYFTLIYHQYKGDDDSIRNAMKSKEYYEVQEVGVKKIFEYMDQYNQTK